MDQLDILDLLRINVVLAAPRLLGMHLVRGDLRAQIVEVEAYGGSDDPASHAYRGQTPRNYVMFGEPGFAYIYLNYGVHWMLNLSAHEAGRGAGILIRAAEPLAGIEEMQRRRPGMKHRDLLNGPGKLGKAFGIGPADNALPLFEPESELRLEIQPPCLTVLTGPRIGLAVGKGDETPWRFMDAGRLDWVSRPLPVQRLVH